MTGVSPELIHTLAWESPTIIEGDSQPLYSSKYKIFFDVLYVCVGYVKVLAGGRGEVITYPKSGISTTIVGLFALSNL